MYALRNKQFWNHLVTFDNILSYSPAVIKGVMKNEKYMNEEEVVYIRATTAGQVFADTLSVHFEYFASRFSNTAHNIPLFLLNDLHDKKQIQLMKRLLNDVYNSVERCCRTLEKYNQKVLQAQRKRHYTEILESPYYYEKKFHEERIVHNHVSYLEAYRSYILGVLNGDSVSGEVNHILLTQMKNYLGLLKYNPDDGIKPYRDLFYSSNSKQLFNELNVCIEYIEDNPALMRDIEITRDYYFTHYRGRRCSFFVERGMYV